jgi:ABC-2 type transport system permease protein
VILSMMLAATGGAWFPLEITGSGFSAVGHVLPVAGILDAFRGIVLRGYGIASVLPAVGIALGYAAVFFGVATWRFRSEA